MPEIVEVHDATGTVTAKVAPGNPCHATFGTTELVIGAQPLELDGAKWTWTTGRGGLAIQKDGEQFARWIVREEMTKGGTAEALDAHGVPFIRISRIVSDVLIATAGGVKLREGRFHKGQPFELGDVTVTGAGDGYDAALIASPEVPVAVRAIAMCGA
jgi:hypothetical protein